MNVSNILKKILSESSTSRLAGWYNGPLTMGEKDWGESALGPFKKKVSDFYNAELQYDSYDGSLDSHKKDRKKLEAKSKRISKYNKKHPQMNDEEGGIINQTPGKGKTFVPIKEWVELDGIDLNEDLAVWFGKKKKPKGSNQPKGPWVNICRKVDGKHPPCGRSDTSKGAYPKCRSAGVAGKMSDSEKRSACQQKRRAEKKDTQTGKGQKPIMTSYKKKKTNEDMKKVLRLTESELIRIIKTVIKEQTGPLTIQPNQSISLNCQTIGRDTMSFDGTIETSSRNAHWGTFNPETNTYVESDELIPSFFVTKVDEYGGFLEGQKITKTFYIEPVTENMRARLGVNIGSSVITYFETSSPKKLRDMETKRFYCSVNSVGSQFRTELQNNGVTVR